MGPEPAGSGAGGLELRDSAAELRIAVGAAGHSGGRRTLEADPLRDPSGGLSDRVSRRRASAWPASSGSIEQSQHLVGGPPWLGIGPLGWATTSPEAGLVKGARPRRVAAPAPRLAPRTPRGSTRTRQMCSHNLGIPGPDARHGDLPRRTAISGRGLDGLAPVGVWADAVGLSVAISGGDACALRPTGPKLLEGILESLGPVSLGVLLASPACRGGKTGTALIRPGWGVGPPRGRQLVSHPRVRHDTTHTIERGERCERPPNGRCRDRKAVEAASRDDTQKGPQRAAALLPRGTARNGPTAAIRPRGGARGHAAAQTRYYTQGARCERPPNGRCRDRKSC